MNMLDVSYSTELYTYKFLTEYDVHCRNITKWKPWSWLSSNFAVDPLLPLSDLSGKGQSQTEIWTWKQTYSEIKGFVHSQHYSLCIQTPSFTVSQECCLRNIPITQEEKTGILSPWVEVAWGTLGGHQVKHGNWVLKKGLHTQSVSGSHQG